MYICIYTALFVYMNPPSICIHDIYMNPLSVMRGRKTERVVINRQTEKEKDRQRERQRDSQRQT